jgi:hypothetical protein
MIISMLFFAPLRLSGKNKAFETSSSLKLNLINNHFSGFV